MIVSRSTYQLLESNYNASMKSNTIRKELDDDEWKNSNAKTKTATTLACRLASSVTTSMYFIVISTTMVVFCPLLLPVEGSSYRNKNNNNPPPPPPPPRSRPSYPDSSDVIVDETESLTPAMGSNDVHDVSSSGNIDPFTFIDDAAADNDSVTDSTSWNRPFDLDDEQKQQQFAEEVPRSLNEYGKESGYQEWYDNNDPYSIQQQPEEATTEELWERDKQNVPRRQQKGFDHQQPSTLPSFRNEQQQQQQQQQQHHQSSRPPPFDATQRTPIHYKFRTTSAVVRGTKPPPQPARTNRFGGRGWSNPSEDDNKNIPITFRASSTNIDDEDSVQDTDKSSSAATAALFVSARNDVITQKLSTFSGKIQLISACGVVGAAIGTFLGKSLGIRNNMTGFVAMIFMFGALLLRHSTSVFGEFVRALGMTLILLIQRSSSLRKQYPTMPHLKAIILRDKQIRKPFPPTRGSPWAWKQPAEDDPAYRFVPYFNMLYSVIAMAFVGSVVGGNLPLLLLPTWLGSMIGAGMFAYATTLQGNSWGDLSRTAGMRVVAMLLEVKEINEEVHVFQKTMTLVGKIFDKLMILDRKHRIKDRIIDMAMFFYQLVSKTAAEAQTGMQQQQERSVPNRRPPADDSLRGRGRPGPQRQEGKAVSQHDYVYSEERQDETKSRPHRRPLPATTGRSSPPAVKDDKTTGGWFSMFKRSSRTDDNESADDNARDYNEERTQSQPPLGNRRNPPRPRNDENDYYDSNAGFQRRQPPPNPY